jgi:hypothetical protein
MIRFMALKWRYLRLWAKNYASNKRCFHSTKVEELPDEMRADQIYVVGEADHLWYVAMLCPCGCKATLQMSLMHGNRPKWHLTEHKDGMISLYPSVRRVKGCHSHFIIRQSKIYWCELPK